MAKVRRQRQALIEEVEQLREDNARLRAEVRRLKAAAKAEK